MNFVRPRRRSVLSAAFVLLLAAVARHAAGANGTREQADAHCARFSAFLPSIEENLLPFYEEGITEDLMIRTVRARSLSARVPGLPLAIIDGQLYVLDGEQQVLSNTWPWQSDNIVVYAHALQHLVSRWGGAIPDVAFVVETSDTPFQDLAANTVTPAANEWGLAASASTQTQQQQAQAQGPELEVWGELGAPGGHGRMPVMRHCKTAESPDLLVPIFHFYTHNFDADMLAGTDRLNAEHPWDSKVLVAFGAGTTYHRHQVSASTVRAWDGKNRGSRVHMLRTGFSDFLSSELRHPNITYAPGNVPLAEWARYAMVMHLDGISCSSRVWQLLALGSVVLREQSGYYAFYDRLLLNFRHQVPFWRYRPREVAWAYAWVVANREAARDIAARGQRFAHDFLNRNAVECYWLLLLGRYAALQRFAPANRLGGMRLQPVGEWLQAQEGRVKDWEPGRVMNRYKDLNLVTH